MHKRSSAASAVKCKKKTVLMNFFEFYLRKIVIKIGHLMWDFVSHDESSECESIQGRPVHSRRTIRNQEESLNET